MNATRPLFASRRLAGLRHPAPPAWPLTSPPTLRSPQPRRAPRRGAHPPRPTVLAVDDAPEVLKVHRRLLEQLLHARVVTTTDGFQALRLIACSAPDLVISDLTRPGLGGLEFLHRLRRFHPAIPALIISGSVHLVTPALEAAFGPCACLPKPFPAYLFLRLIRRLLRRRSRSYPWFPP